MSLKHSVSCSISGKRIANDYGNRQVDAEQQYIIRLLENIFVFSGCWRKRHIDEEEQDSAHTLTFTLPLQVPTGGASLRVYDCYYDKSLRKVVDHTGRVLRQSSDYCRQSMPYEDVAWRNCKS